MGEAQGYYEQREAELGAEIMREVERQVMLRIIDQRWREHLYEMDYLQEGINLRAMGQKDPLVEWQREGFEMFGEMMQGIAQDFVRYVMHAQVTVTEQATDEPPTVDEHARTPGRTIRPVPADRWRPRPRHRRSVDQGAGAAPPQPEEEQVNAPVVKSEWDKTPRNAPCPCGSGKKFKLCHGR